MVLDAILEEGQLDPAGFVDNSGAVTSLLGYPVLGSDDFLASPEIQKINGFVVGFGGTNALRQRAVYFDRLVVLGLTPWKIIHPSAVVSRFAQIERGTCLLARSVVNPSATIGENVILNTGCVVEHDCVVGDHTHIAPSATLSGGVTVGRLALIGAGAVILPGLDIGEESIVGAGAVVTKNVGQGVKVVGNPARLIGPR